VCKSESARLEDRGLDGRVILQLIFQEVGWGMDWVDLAQKRDNWLAFVSAMTKLVS
jgi:hypothetical protein